MNHDAVLNYLIREASENPKVAGARVVAALVYRGNLILTARNEYRSHPLQKKYAENKEKIYLHAEINAIAKSRRHLSTSELESSTIYVARAIGSVSKGFSRANAKPCKGCQMCIDAFRIKNVIYT